MKNSDYTKMDYFSPKTGYTIEGVTLGGATAARNYLVSVCCMETCEANSLLRRLYNLFQTQNQSCAAGKGV